MSYTFKTSSNINDNLQTLTLIQQPYLSTSQILIFINNNQIIYHGYKNKSKQQPKTQANAQKALEDSKPKKKFNFKVSKNTQTKPILQTFQKVPIFSIQKNYWEHIQLKGKPPLPRENHSIISMNQNTLIMYGGKSLQNQKLLNDLHVLNTQTFLWKKLFSIQCPLASQSNLIIKLTETKILLINFKQFWTFQSKDVKWELNTNQLPGGLWQNLQIKVDSILNPQRQIILSGLSIGNVDNIQNALIFTVDKNSQHINSYFLNSNSKEITKITMQKDIFVDELQNVRNFLTCSSIDQNQSQEKQNLILMSFKKKDAIQIILFQFDLSSLCLKNIVSKQSQQRSNIISNFNGQCFDKKNQNLYFLATNETNTKQKQLKTISFRVEMIKQRYSHIESFTKNQMAGLMKSSQIQSIPEQSNQSSLIGIKNHQNQRYQEFEDDPETQPYHQHQHYFMANSQRQKNSSRPASQVNRSPSVLSNQQKSQHSDNQSQKNDRPIRQSHIDHKNCQQNKSNIYFSPGSQLKNSSIQMQNNSSFPEQQYLQSTLQKILIFQHLKRQKLQEKTQFLQRSIKNSQNLSKLLTKFAMQNQKNHHIDQVKYLKQQLENIWNKEIFFRKQIHQHFVNNQTQTNNQRQSKQAKKQKNKGKIDMKKLFQKHHLLEEE